jgi:hypothetical protein
MRRAPPTWIAWAVFTVAWFAPVRFRDAVGTFVGRHVTAMRVQVLHGELNQVYSGLEERLVSIQGDIGGELLKVVDVTALPELGVVDQDQDFWIWQPPQAAKLFGHAARAVGELAFEGLPTETLLYGSPSQPK